MPEIGIRYFGNSAFEVTSEEGLKVLVDPCITGSGGVGVTPVSLDEVTNVDLILVTHAAGDHLGDTLELAKRTGCQVLAGREVAYYLEANGVKAERFIRASVWGMVSDFRGMKIRIVKSEHVSWLQWRDMVLTGIPLGFILYTESGLGIYIAGDTSIFSDLKLFGELYKPQIGFLPVGPFGSASAMLSPREAAMVANWMRLKVVFPCHYPSGSNLPQQFAEIARQEAPTTKVITLNWGERTIYRF